MCVGYPIAVVWSSSQWRPDGEFETDRVPPGNRLEALKGKWRGFHSIRINDQWRVVFRWESGNAFDVQVIDYH